MTYSTQQNRASQQKWNPFTNFIFVNFILFIFDEPLNKSSSLENLIKIAEFFEGNFFEGFNDFGRVHFWFDSIVEEELCGFPSLFAPD